MTDWVRLWHDMPTDPKWRTIARKSGQPLPCVIALFNLIMVNASANADERGTLRNWDSEDAAAALDMEPDDVSAIITAMQGKVLDGDRLTGWEKRQPKREDDGAAARKRAQRSREKTQKDDVSRNVTQRHAPETETETDIPFSNENGAKVVDPAKVMFDGGISLITAAGKSEGQARSWLGKVRKTYGPEAVIVAIGAAKREGALDPISFMEASLRARDRQTAKAAAFTGPC